MVLLENIFSTILFSGIIFFIMALIMYNFPPKEINSLYGYRTPNSIKSQERWDFSQKYSSKLMIQIGVFMIVISFLGVVFPQLNAYKPEIEIVTILTFTFSMIAMTEYRLKKKFPNS